MDANRKWEIISAALATAASVERSRAAEHPPDSVQFQKHMAHADEYQRLLAWIVAKRDTADTQGE